MDLPSKPHNETSSTWPPEGGLTTVIVPRASTILPIHARTTIAAPASLIWSILRDTSAYPTWNSFCPHVTIHSQPPNAPPAESSLLHLSTSFTFHVVMDSAKPSKVTDTQLRVTDVSTPKELSGYVPEDVLRGDGTFEGERGRVWRMAWTTEGGFVARGLRTERFHEIIVLGEGEECEVRTWECQGGILARAVKFYYKDVLMGKFGEWLGDLKREAERRAREGRGG